MSKETWEYDAALDGAWTIHEETIACDLDDGSMVVALDRRVGMAPLSASELPLAEHLCAEAFVDRDDKCCVPRQIAAVLKLDYGLVCNELTEIERKLYGASCMDTQGCTPRMVSEFARGRGLGGAISHNSVQLELLPGPTPIVAALLEDHLYFYEGRARKKLLKWRTAPTKSVKLRREHVASTTTPAASE